jgi:hypothetical protein
MIFRKRGILEITGVSTVWNSLENSIWKRLYTSCDGWQNERMNIILAKTCNLHKYYTCSAFIRQSIDKWFWA